MSYFKTSAAACSLVVFFALLLTGCGASNSSAAKAPTTISEDQINATAITLAQSLSANVKAANVSICSNAFQDFYFCAAPIAVTSLCITGKSTATGQISDSWGFYASGLANAALTVMPAACSVTGTNLTVTSNPSLAATGTVGYFYAQPESALMTETGMINYGPSPSGSCAVNLTLNAIYPLSSNVTASCKVTGTLCGQTISQSCQ